MKQKSTTQPISPDQLFLQKFAGKLNTVTKHGEIANQKGEKALVLPLINNLSNHNSNTMSITRKKTHIYSRSSEGQRNYFEVTQSVNRRVSKNQTQRNDKILGDIPNIQTKSKFSQQNNLKRLRRHQKQNANSNSMIFMNPMSERFQIRKIKCQDFINKQDKLKQEELSLFSSLQRKNGLRRGKMLVI